MNPTLETLKTRRSCRKYLARPVEEETLCAILEAGMYAPTGKNRMAPKMVVVRDKETIAALSRMNAAVMGTENDPFYGAPPSSSCLRTGKCPPMWRMAPL